MTADDIIREYPDLECEDIRHALAYASALANEEIHPLTPRLMEVLSVCADALGSGALIVVEDHAYRVRRLPIQA